nr:peptidyl-tRNA hydrolase, mitochondrial [Ipomoea batatas]
MLSRICRRSFCSAFPQPWLFIGLGNLGDKYKGTRHNVGFDMVDAFAESVGIQMEDVHCKAIFGKGFLNGVPVFLAKPQTYMNLSGESFHDDMDLLCGVLRLHPKGGHHSHNGVMGNTLLDNWEFNALKESVSIGRAPGQMDPKAFLLQKFNATAREWVDVALQEGVGALKQLVSKGLTESSRCFNTQQKYKHIRLTILLVHSFFLNNPNMIMIQAYLQGYEFTWELKRSSQQQDRRSLRANINQTNIYVQTSCVLRMEKRIP